MEADHQPQSQPERHRYLSTACLHREHGKCRNECKFCRASCTCPCHDEPRHRAGSAARGGDDGQTSH